MSKIDLLQLLVIYGERMNIAVYKTWYERSVNANVSTWKKLGILSQCWKCKSLGRSKL